MEYAHNTDSAYDDYKFHDRIESASLVYFGLIAVLSLTTSYYHDFPGVILCMVFIETLIYIFRKSIFYKIKKAGRTSSAYRNLQRLSAIGLYAAAIAWSLFCTITYSLYGMTLPTFIVMLSAVAITSCAIFVFSADYNRARVFVSLLILPYVIWCVISGNESSHIIAGLSLFYLLIILKNMGGYNNWFIAKRNAIQYLNKQAVTLTEMNSRLRSEIQYRKSMERALRKSEERYKTLFENNPIATIIVDHAAKITGLNYARKATTGRLPKIGETMYKDYGARHRNNMFKELMDSMQTGLKKEFPEQEYDDRFLYIKFSPFSGGAIITSVDITDQKQAETQIQALTREIMTVQEKERKRISRDLHDSVAQELSTLRITCETFFDDMSAANISSIENKVKNMSKVLHGSIQTVRDIAYELRPPCLDEFGLGTTIFRYCEEFSSKTDINADFFSAGVDKLKVDPEVEINIYRLIQEALNNVKKHAGASHVIVRLVASFPNIIVRIEDNGHGFEKELQEKAGRHSKSMGLRGMEERVLLFGGTFKIISKPGKGTRIVVEVPTYSKAEIQICHEAPVAMSS